MIARLLLFLWPLVLLGQSQVRVVNTLADLDAWKPSSNQPLVRVLGKVTIGDWGPAREYKYDATSTSATSLVCRLPAAPYPGRWVFDWNGDVRVFGAIPDDSVDDTDALQEAANAALEFRKTLYLPGSSAGGVYYADRGIIITNAANNRPKLGGLRGDGTGRSRILSRSNNVSVVKLRGMSMTVEGLTIGFSSYQYPSNTSATCLELAGFNSMHTIRNCQFVNGYYGIRNTSDDSGYSTFSTLFENVTLENCGEGVDIVSGSGNVVNNLYFTAYLLPYCGSAITDRAGATTYDQVNIEHSNFRKTPFLMQNDGASIGRLHYEGVRVFNSEPLISVSESAVPIDHWTIINSYFNGYRISSIVANGTEATATIDDMSDTQAGGHGILVGDTVYVSGASDALYNGARTVTAITSTTFSYALTGSPASPAQTDYTTSDYISVNRGTSSSSASSLADTTVYARPQILVRALKLRDNRVLNAVSANRNGLLVFNEAGRKGRFIVDAVETGSIFEPQVGRYLAANPVIAAQVTSSVGTFWTRQPHGLSTNELVYVQANTPAVRTMTNWSVLSTPTTHSFTVSIPSSDIAFTREAGGGFAVNVAARVTSRSRSGNVATAYTDRAHGLKPGYKCAIHNSTDSSFNNLAAVALTVPTTTSFTYRAVGSDSVETADSQAVVTVYDAGVSEFLVTSTHTGLLRFGDAFSQAVALSSNVLASGSLDKFTNTINGLRLGDVVRLAPFDVSNWNDDLLISGYASGNNTLTVVRRNIGTGSVTNLGGVYSVEFRR